MGKISQKHLEGLYKPLICTQTIQIDDNEALFGDKKKRVMKFDIYDGFAYCADYKGEEYYMIYPQLDFIKISKEMSQAVKEYVGLKDTDPIQVTDILTSYNTLYRV